MTDAYTAGNTLKKDTQASCKADAPGNTFMLGIAELRVAQAPQKLVTLGLGSCVGLVLYDPVSKTGGMVHIMLPSAPPGAAASNKAKFADTAIAELLRAVLQAGAVKSRLIAKFAGGAHMFNAVCSNDIMNVGERNIQMCRKMLQECGIRTGAEDTGGTCGRSIEFCCETGMLQVRTISPKSIRLL